MDVPPGRYAIAGAMVELESTSETSTSMGSRFTMTMSNTKYTPISAYFPDELVRSLSVEVKGGDIASVGHVHVATIAIEELDEAGTYAVELAAPNRVKGRLGAISGKFHYAAATRGLDQSAARLDEIVRDVRAALSLEGWPDLEQSGPTTVAAVDYTVPEVRAAREREATRTAKRAEGSIETVSLQLQIAEGAEISAESMERFEKAITARLDSKGFDVVESGADVALDIEVDELTAGSRRQRMLSLAMGNPILRYSMTAHGPDGKILGRTAGEEVFERTFFGAENPAAMSEAAILDWLIDRTSPEIVTFAAMRVVDPEAAAAEWTARPRVRLVLNDRVGTDYSATGLGDLENMLGDDLASAGYVLGDGANALILEVNIERYDAGSRAKRLIGIPGVGASGLVYEATVRDASGKVIGTKRGEKKITGNELVHNTAFKSDEALRLDLANFCSEQLSGYVRSLWIPDVSTGPAVGESAGH